MKAIIFCSMSKKQCSRGIANQIEGDHFEIIKIGGPKKSEALKMAYFGFLVLIKKLARFQSPYINFDNYNEIILVSPVWGGKVNAYMAQYLKKNQFKDKEVTIISSSLGDNKKYFKGFNKLLDKSNKVVKHIDYVKGIKVYEKKV